MEIMRIVLFGTLMSVMAMPIIKMRFKMARHSPTANRMICVLDSSTFISLIVSIWSAAGYELHQSVPSVPSVPSVLTVLSSDFIGVIVGSV